MAKKQFPLFENQHLNNDKLQRVLIFHFRYSSSPNLKEQCCKMMVFKRLRNNKKRQKQSRLQEHFLFASTTQHCYYLLSVITHVIYSTSIFNWVIMKCILLYRFIKEDWKKPIFIRYSAYKSESNSNFQHFLHMRHTGILY